MSNDDRDETPETTEEISEETAATLPQALSGLVDGEHPSPGLRERVAAGVSAGPARTRRVLVPIAVAAALAVVALVAGVAGSGSGDDDVDLATDPDPAESPSTTEEPEVLGDVTRRTATTEGAEPTGPSSTTTSTPEAPAPPPPPPTTVAPTIAPSPTTAPPPPTTTPPTTTPPTTRPAPTTGSIVVEVQPAEGASRSVQLFGGDGSPRSGRIPVTGEPTLFPDLAPGGYGVVVEEDSGGALTASRTEVTVAAGDEVRLRCDSATLDCARI